MGHNWKTKQIWATLDGPGRTDDHPVKALYAQHRPPVSETPTRWYHLVGIFVRPWYADTSGTCILFDQYGEVHSIECAMWKQAQYKLRKHYQFFKHYPWRQPK